MFNYLTKSIQIKRDNKARNIIRRDITPIEITLNFLPEKKNRIRFFNNKVFRCNIPLSTLYSIQEQESSKHPRLS